MAAKSAKQAQQDADMLAIETMRQNFGNAEAAKLAADLYKLQRTPDTGWLSSFPRSIVILIAIWVGLLETADKLPKLLLSYPAYEATLAEYHAKMMQPDLVKAQLAKATNEATASSYMPAKVKAEAQAAKWQPALTAAQGFAAQMQWLSGAPNDEWKKSGNLAIAIERP